MFLTAARKTRTRAAATLGRALLRAAVILAAARHPASAASGLVAVLPVDNLTGHAAPLDDVRSRIEEALRARGVPTLEASRVDEVLRANRIRFTGGVPDRTAAAFRDAGGAGAVLVTSLAALEDADPPRVALEARLVSLEGEFGRPVWAHGVALAGDDAPGAFDLGLVHDPEALLDRAVGAVADSLAAFQRAGPPAGPPRPPDALGRFGPRALYVSPDAPEFGSQARRVVVLPFLNDTSREGAGDVVSLQFIRELVSMGAVEVVEPGRVRDVLLSTRLVQEGGISHAQADLLRSILEVDMVIAGRVSEFREDPGGSSPFVELGAYGLDTAKRQVAWLGRAYSVGSKGAHFFRLGEVRSAARLSWELARGMLRDVVRRSGRR